MAKYATTLLLVVVVFFFFLISASMSVASNADADAPFIVAYKKASLNRLKSGAKRVSISIDIYNQTAYDVSLVDNNWPQDIFEIVSGNTSNSWERLDMGGLLSHSFELEGKVKGMFYSSPAVITFHIPTKAASQAYSTPIVPLDILAERPPEKSFEWAKRPLAKYRSLISVILIVVLFVYVISMPSKSSAAKATKKRR